VALPGAKSDLRRTLQLADDVRLATTDVVVLGSGALALGIRALATALVPSPPASDGTRAPRLHVCDRVEPARFAALLADLDLGTTVFDVVDGDGEAPATMGHFLIVRDRLLQELGAVEYQKHVVVTTRTADGALRQIVNDEGFRSLSLPDGVADAAALLSAAALFPLACIGIDVAEVLAGGAAMLERRHAADGGFPPAHLVALGLQLAGPMGISVAAPAGPTLAGVASWIAHRATGLGASPGARAAVALIVGLEAVADLAIPKTYQDLESVGYLGGQGLAALAVHERAADEIAHWTAGELTVALTLPDLTPHALGQTVALTEAAIALASGAVEVVADGGDRPRLVDGLAGRPGYEAERAEAQRRGARREDRYVA
jgi:glucose-6-phosphate isomerase